MNPKILVTGATGTIGSFVVENFKKENANFCALARNEEKAKVLNDKGVETRIGDFSNIESLRDALNGIDKIFLLSVTSPDAPELQGNVISVAKEIGIKHIVKLSSLGTSLESPFNIPKWHAQIQEKIIKAGINYTFLHPHSFMQNLLFDAQTIKQQSAIYSTLGEGKISMVDARDIAAVAAQVLISDKHYGNTYEITGPVAISNFDIAEALSASLGRKINYIPISAEEGHKEMLKSGLPDWLANDLTGMNKIFSEGKGSKVSDAVENITGRPAISINDFIKDYISFFE